MRALSRSVMVRDDESAPRSGIGGERRVRVSEDGCEVQGATRNQSINPRTNLAMLRGCEVEP